MKKTIFVTGILVTISVPAFAGNLNWAGVGQFGFGNLAGISQGGNGNHNTATVGQIGALNTSVIGQGGYGNINKAGTFQFGVGNGSIIVQQ